MTEELIKKNLDRATKLYKKLSKAEKVTGQEIGLLSFYSFFILANNTNACRKDKFPYKPEEMTAFLEQIAQDEEQRTIFLTYRNLLTAVHNAYEYYLAVLASIEKGYKYNLYEMLYLNTAEDCQREQDNTPLIVTESQYNNLLEQTKEYLLEEQETFYNVFFIVLTNFVAKPELAPQFIKDIFETYKQIDDCGFNFNLLKSLQPFNAKTDKEKLLFLETFKDRYKLLYNALDIYLCNNTFSVSVADKEPLEAIIPLKDLSKHSIVGFEDCLKPTNKAIALYLNTENTPEGWRKARRVTNCGLSIIKNPSPACIDSEGNYKPLQQENLLLPKSIDNPKYKYEDEKKEVATNLEQWIYNRLKSVFAYNELLKLIEQAYSIKGLFDYCSINLEGLHGYTKLYNNTIDEYIGNVYGNNQQIKHKRKLIKDMFQKIDLKKCEPTKNNIERVKKIVFEAQFNPSLVGYYFARLSDLVKMLIRGE